MSDLNYYILLVETESWRREWKKTQTLRSGTKLYHGTSQDFEPDEIDGPAWFSTNKNVAEEFSKWHDGDPKIFQYKLSKSIILPRIDNFSEMFGIESEWGAESIIDSIRRTNLPGWIIPDNYKPGDDILLVDTSILILM